MSLALLRRVPSLALLTLAVLLAALAAPTGRAQAEETSGSKAGLEHVYLQLSGMT